jgi:hypothetical protein
MELRFGSPLTLKDGTQVGAIQRVVLESETQRLRALTLRTGYVFARERVIGVGLLTPSEDGRRVVADLDATDIGHLPTISEVDLTDTTGNRSMVQPYTTWTGGEMPVATYVGGSAAVNRRRRPSFDLPEADRDVTLVSSHTTVHGSGGEKIGTVCALVCDTAGTAIGLLIRRSQLFRSREIYIPTDLATYSGTTAGLLGLEWKE